MPDLFVAPDEKSLRSRMPVPPQEGISVPVLQTLNQNTLRKSQPIIQTAEKNTIDPAPLASIIQSPNPSDNIPSSSQNTSQTTNSTPHYDDIERRNAMPLLASFWQNPHSIYFDTQEPNERILLFLRRHFITNVPWIAFTILLLIIPPFAIFLLHVANYPLTFLPFPLMQIILFLYYLLVLTNAFVNFIDWYYNITIITTDRVLDIQLKDLVSKKVSATKISLIQDVDFKQIGTIPSIFNYGDVIMQTAGKEVNFVADAVPNPELVVQIVEGLLGKEEVQGGVNAAV